MARLVENLKLSAAAYSNIVSISPIGEAHRQNRVSLSLVGKVFSSKAVNRETLKTQLPRILQTTRNIEVEVTGDNRFIAVFATESDRRRAMYDGPWHFFQNLMVFKAAKGLQNPFDVEFEEFSVRAQLYNLPIACMDSDMVRRLGAQLGRVDEVDVSEGGFCLGKFARVRVTRHLDKPLQRYIGLSTGESGESGLVVVIYERLPDFCFACGRVTHVLRDCMDPGADKRKLAFGIWLKASRGAEVRRTRAQASFARESSATNEGSGEGENNFNNENGVETEVQIVKESSAALVIRVPDDKVDLEKEQPTFKIITSSDPKQSEVVDEQMKEISEEGGATNDTLPSKEDIHELSTMSELQPPLLSDNGKRVSWKRRARKKDREGRQEQLLVKMDVGEKREIGNEMFA